jgi:hypothetical protein
MGQSIYNPGKDLHKKRKYIKTHPSAQSLPYSVFFLLCIGSVILFFQSSDFACRLDLMACLFLWSD